MKLAFTQQQLADWRAYEKVRKGGRYNMIMDGRALVATRLTKARYLFVIEHYEELMEAVLGEGGKR